MCMLHLCLYVAFMYFAISVALYLGSWVFYGEHGTFSKVSVSLFWVPSFIILSIMYFIRILGLEDIYIKETSHD